MAMAMGTAMDMDIGKAAAITMAVLFKIRTNFETINLYNHSRK
jgi:hypothetical protein